MLYREIIAVCSEIHTKHINTLCGQNVELLNVWTLEGYERLRDPSLEISCSQLYNLAVWPGCTSSFCWTELKIFVEKKIVFRQKLSSSNNFPFNPFFVQINSNPLNLIVTVISTKCYLPGLTE